MFGTYRTLLALMVVATHLGGISAISVYAVFGFYVISGYLMTLIMQEDYGYSLSGIYKYLVNRFLRIYPTYWSSIILSLILIYIVGEEYSSNYHSAMYFPRSDTEIIKNILIFFPDREYPRLTPPVWALTVEIFFYILISLGLSKNKWLVMGWLIISISYHVIALYFGYGWIKRYYTISAASLPYAAGAWVYHYKDILLKYTSRIMGKTEQYLPYIIFVCMLINWFIGIETGHGTGISFYVNFVICVLMVAVLSERKALPVITKRIDKWLGDFSYPIYLFHYQTGLILVFLMGKVGFTLVRRDIKLMIVSLPLLFVISWGAIVLFVKPIDKVRKSIKQTNSRKHFQI